MISEAYRKETLGLTDRSYWIAVPANIMQKGHYAPYFRKKTNEMVDYYRKPTKERESCEWHKLPKGVYDHKKYPSCPHCLQKYVGKECLPCEYQRRYKYK